MIFFGKSYEERKHLKAIEHFLGKRIRYGRDVLPEKTLTRLHEARVLAKEAMGWITPGGRREVVLHRLESQYGEIGRAHV